MEKKKSSLLSSSSPKPTSLNSHRRNRRRVTRDTSYGDESFVSPFPPSPPHSFASLLLFVAATNACTHIHAASRQTKPSLPFLSLCPCLSCLTQLRSFHILLKPHTRAHTHRHSFPLDACTTLRTIYTRALPCRLSGIFSTRLPCLACLSPPPPSRLFSLRSSSLPSCFLVFK